MENLTKKHKQIIAAVVAVLVVVLVGVTVALSMNKPTNEDVDSTGDKYGTLVVEYGEKFETDQFTVIRGEEEVSIRIEDLDTMKIGDTEYTAIAEEDIELKITVRVEDTQFPVIEGEDKFVIKLGESIELKEKLTAEDPVDGVVELKFELPELDEAKEYEVEVSATDVNDNKTTKTIIIEVKEDLTEEDKAEAADKDNSKPKKEDVTANAYPESEAVKPKPQPKPDPKPQPKPEVKPQPKPEANKPAHYPSNSSFILAEGDKNGNSSLQRRYVSSVGPDRVDHWAGADLFYIGNLSDGSKVEHLGVWYDTLQVNIVFWGTDGGKYMYGVYPSGEAYWDNGDRPSYISSAVEFDELPALAAKYKSYFSPYTP